MISPQIRERFYAMLYRPMDASGLAVVRMLFGLIIMYEAWRYVDLSHMVNKYYQQNFYFKFRFFEWIEPTSMAGMQWLFIIYGLAGAAIFLGVFYHLATLVAFLVISYIFLLDFTNYLNHFYLVIIFSAMMFFIPAYRCWSVYALWHPQKRSDTVLGWSVWLIRTQLVIVYFYAAIAKMNVDWINGMPLYDWIGEQATEFGINSHLDSTWVIYAFTYVGLLYDLIAAPLLLYQRTRAFAYCLTICFHLMNYLLFNIGIFPWFMLATSTIFFNPSWPRDFLHFFWPQSFKLIDPPLFVHANLNNLQKVGLLCMCLHLAFQAGFPLRHFFYRSYVGWSEEGHNFSWHMKLRDKVGTATFLVVDPDTRKSQIIDASNFLTKRQYSKMATRPFMILQFAHYLRDHYTGPGEKPAEIYVETRLSVNSRDEQRLIDPTVNLALVEQKEFGNGWILPLRQPVWNAQSKKNRFGPALKTDEIAKKAIPNLSNVASATEPSF